VLRGVDQVTERRLPSRAERGDVHGLAEKVDVTAGRGEQRVDGGDAHPVLADAGA
jgi:hypothetical protein